jgi:hypothetical protein
MALTTSRMFTVWRTLQSSNSKSERKLTMITDLTTFADYSGNHAYEITTDKGRFVVHANNRTQAATRLRRKGFTVYDVNMIG